jgi:putative hydroxymethylpyrimidine transport system permease protein
MRRSPVIAIGVMAGLIIWEGLVRWAAIPRYLLPGPLDIANETWASWQILAENAVVTAAEMLAALSCSIVIGVLLGLFLAYSETARLIVRPILVFSQTIPIFAIAPLMTLWLGYGFLPKLVTATLVIFFPLASAFTDALLFTPRAFLDLAAVMNASRINSLRLIRLPAAMPGLATGLRLAAVYAPIGVVLGEWVGASQGLGYIMLLANGRGKTSLMFAALFVLGVLTLVLTRSVEIVARRLERQSA